MPTETEPELLPERPEELGTGEPVALPSSVPEPSAEGTTPIPTDPPQQPQLECPRGGVQVIDLEIFTEDAKVIATGQLMNQSTGEVLAADYSTPTIYGLDESGKWVTLIHRGTLTPAWDTGAVSPAGFVLEPGTGADFEMEGELDGLEQVTSWYPVPAPDLLWNEHNFYQECPGPGAGYVVPAPAS